MDAMLNRKDFNRVVEHFGIERVIAALPQHEVCGILELVCVKDLSKELGVSYDTFRSYMQEGTIPYPEVRLLRRTYFRKEEAEAIRTKLRNSKKKIGLAPKQKER